MTITAFDPIELELFKNLFVSISEEMGAVLGRTALSPNIKERKDFSCALFNQHGETFAQGSHIPVHLGAMPLSVQASLKSVNFKEGDLVVLNDPYRGGTHLPDLTCISPLFVNKKLRFFVDEPILMKFTLHNDTTTDDTLLCKFSLMDGNDVISEYKIEKKLDRGSVEFVDVKLPVVHHVEGAFPVVPAFADAAHPGQGDGSLAFLFFQDIDLGDILGLDDMDLPFAGDDVFDFTPKSQNRLNLLGKLQEPAVVGGAGDIGLALDPVHPVPAIAEFPVPTNHLGHDAGAVDEGHDHDPHGIHVQIRGLVEFLLALDG